MLSGSTDSQLSLVRKYFSEQCDDANYSVEIVGSRIHLSVSVKIEAIYTFRWRLRGECVPVERAREYVRDCFALPFIRIATALGHRPLPEDRDSAELATARLNPVCACSVSA